MKRRNLALALLQDLLAAPGSQEGWHTFLTNLCDALSGSGGNFISHDFTTQTGHVSVTARTPPEAIALYHDHWSQFDAWALKGGRLPAGTVVTGDRLMPRREFERTAFCGDYGRHYDIFQCLEGVVESSPQTISVVSVNADNRRERFGADDLELITILMPSLQRALQIHRRLAGAELMASTAMDVLDRLQHGVFLVSARGVVLATNRAADEIVRGRDGLTIDAGELRCSTVGATNQLRGAIEAAVRTGQGVTIESRRTALALPRPSGLRPLAVVIAPLPARVGSRDCTAAAAAIFITDPERSVVPDADVIRPIFCLTAGEAEVVRCLLAGLNPEQTATRLGLQVDTVRKRLKIAFEKTDTHRQADLVRVVLASLAPSMSA